MLTSPNWLPVYGHPPDLHKGCCCIVWTWMAERYWLTAQVAQYGHTMVCPYWRTHPRGYPRQCEPVAVGLGGGGGGGAGRAGLV
jgi:hypothetical protein